MRRAQVRHRLAPTRTLARPLWPPSQYTYVPLVYVITVPIWLLLCVAWTWNTYYVNTASARDLHRLMCWVPIMEFVHGLLSLFNCEQMRMHAFKWGHA